MTPAPATPADIDTLHQIVAPARRNLSRETWDYLMGGAETETTLTRNRQAIDALALRPRVLNDVSSIDLSTTLLGHALRLPVILAPIGSLQDLCPEGGLAPARAAVRSGVVHMLSSVCKPGLAEVAAAAPGHPKLFQLYVRGDAAWVDARVEEAIAAGYSGLCLTVDLDHYGRRERDIAKGYKPTARRTGGGTGDPFQARFTWKDIARIRKRCTIPMILKGLAVAEDAVKAVEHGIDVVYVSNHGGRQLDHGLAGIDVLPEIVGAVAGRAEVVVDGGFMRGTDIVKAVALGARAIGLGRLQGLALAAGGEDVLVRVLDLLADEMTRALGLLGVSCVAELGPRHVAPARPIGRTGMASAFPLIDEGY